MKYSLISLAFAAATLLPFTVFAQTIKINNKAVFYNVKLCLAGDKHCSSAAMAGDEDSVHVNFPNKKAVSVGIYNSQNGKLLSSGLTALSGSQLKKLKKACFSYSMTSGGYVLYLNKLHC